MLLSWNDAHNLQHYRGTKLRQQLHQRFTMHIKFRKTPRLLIFLKLANWKGNLNYWTGGAQGCKGNWGWCAGSEVQPFTANLSWGSGQPELIKEKENCLHLRITQNSSGVLLSDRECKDKYIFACEAKNVRFSNYLPLLFHLSEGTTN